jgi:hypothetical protein
MDELVKDSVPVEEKKPLMESAWATATLLTARAARTTKRLIIKKGSPGSYGFTFEECPRIGCAHLSCQLKWMKFLVNRTERKELVLFISVRQPAMCKLFFHCLNILHSSNSSAGSGSAK